MKVFSIILSVQLNLLFQELDDIDGKLYDLLTKRCYDFVMLHLCYIYFDILNDDVTVLYKNILRYQMSISVAYIIISC